MPAQIHTYVYERLPVFLCDVSVLTLRRHGAYVCVCVWEGKQKAEMGQPTPTVHLVHWQLLHNHGPIISGFVFSNLLWQGYKSPLLHCKMSVLNSVFCQILTLVQNSTLHETSGSNIWFMSCLEWETLPGGEGSRWKQRQTQSVWTQNVKYIAELPFGIIERWKELEAKLRMTNQRLQQVI